MELSRVAVPGKVGHFRVHDQTGADRGDIVLDHPHATVIAQAMIDGANRVLATMAGEIAYATAGWSSKAEYDAEFAAITAIVGEKDDPDRAPLRAQVSAAWRARPRAFPLNRTQMAEWTAEADRIVWQHENGQTA